MVADHAPRRHTPVHAKPLRSSGKTSHGGSRAKPVPAPHRRAHITLGQELVAQDRARPGEGDRAARAFAPGRARGQDRGVPDQLSGARAARRDRALAGDEPESDAFDEVTSRSTPKLTKRCTLMEALSQAA